MLRQRNYLGIYLHTMWGKPAPIRILVHLFYVLFVLFYILFVWPAHSFLPACILSDLLIFNSVDLATKHAFTLLRWVYHLSISFYQHYYYYYYFGGLAIAFFCYILYLNTPCINLLYTKLLGHTTLNGLITKSASCTPSPETLN